MKKIVLLLFIVAAFSACDDSNSDKLVTIKTNFGEMTVLLYEETPLHKANFLELAESGKYDSTIFHRVIESFMIQGGDMHLNKPTQELADDRIDAEIVDTFFHEKGALAAARQPDNVNPAKKSSSCQFYIVQGRVWSEEELTLDQQKLNEGIRVLLRMEKYDSLKQQFAQLQREGKGHAIGDLIMASRELVEQELGMDLAKEISTEKLDAYSSLGGYPPLDGEYTVFGRVVEGLEVIDKIASVQKAPGDRPLDDIFIFMEMKKMSKTEITKKYGYEYPAEKSN